MKQTTNPRTYHPYKTAVYWLISALLPQLAKSDEVYSAELPECPARIERRSVEPGLLIFRNDCPLSLRSLANLLDEGLQGLFPEGRIDVRSIQLGRLMEYPKWSQALAEAASQSSAWDSRRGKPRNKKESPNLVVTRLLNNPAYPDQLKPVFSRYGLEACIAQVEKVLVFEAKDMMPAESLQVSGIAKDARLPFDAQIWLTLIPETSDCAKR